MPQATTLIELPVATIQHMALYTNLSSLEIATKTTESIENYNQISIDTKLATVKMAEQLVTMTRNVSLDNTKV